MKMDTYHPSTRRSRVGVHDTIPSSISMNTIQQTHMTFTNMVQQSINRMNPKYTSEDD